MKTYYSKYNKDAYIRMRKDFNEKKDDFLRLYLLLIYGFNHMIRFNGKGDFNLPVGNVDFNNNVYQALNNYLEFVGEHEIEFLTWIIYHSWKRLSLERIRMYFWIHHI